MRRPASIVWFERLAYVSLALTFANCIVVYESMRGVPEIPGASRGLVIMILLATLAVYVPLIRFAAHRASKAARWALAVLLGLHLLGLLNLPAILAYGGVSAAIAIIQFPISATLIFLLFRAEANLWFAGGGPVDPDVFS